MHKKGSMELSVNSIVILVIAVVMMGLILGFIRTKFADISKDIIKDEPAAPEATSSEPLTMSKTTVVTTAAKKTALKLAFFNTNTSDLHNTTVMFECKNGIPTITPEYFSKDVPSGSMATFEGTIKTSSVAKETYLCRICMWGTDKVNPTSLPKTCSGTAPANWFKTEREFTLVLQ